ncbi:MAG: hypothetical protein AAB631_00245, partial [Patescibacteria group bacterium]
MLATSTRRTFFFVAAIFLFLGGIPYIAHGTTTGAIHPVADGTNDSASWAYQILPLKDCSANVCY